MHSFSEFEINSSREDLTKLRERVGLLRTHCDEAIEQVRGGREGGRERGGREGGGRERGEGKGEIGREGGERRKEGKGGWKEGKGEEGGKERERG